MSANIPESMNKKKIIALIIGDSFGTGLEAATSLAQKHARYEVVLVDSSTFYLGRAQREVSKLSQCSTITADLSMGKEVQKVIDLIENPNIWIQYLVHTNNELVADLNNPNVAAQNEGIYKITQAAFKNMYSNRSGQIRNKNTLNEVAYNIIDYQPDTKLPYHTHAKGEVLYVIDGVYSDEDGHSHQNEYIRNPVDSDHTPFSNEGSLILVVHKKMAKEDQAVVRANIQEASWTRYQDSEFLTVHQYQQEKISFVREHNNGNFKPWLYDNGGEIAHIPSQNEDKQIVLFQSQNLPF